MSKFVHLSPSLKSLSAQSVVVSNIADEVRALFPEEELPGLRYRIELIREICLACKNHSSSSRVQFASDSDLISLIVKVHTGVFGPGDSKDDLFLEEVVAYLIESGQVVQAGFVRRFFLALYRIFR